MAKKPTPKSKSPARPAKVDYPAFLRELLEAKSPTGHEFAAQQVVDRHVAEAAKVYRKDRIGNRIAETAGKGGPTLLLAGHIDEIGLILSHVDDKGYLYFDFLGGHDQVIPSGRRVHILTKHGAVLGVTGKRAVHLMSP
jgi:tetrahedral aminopeptidase